MSVIADRLHLPTGALTPTCHVLADYGNCSSTTVLIVLGRLLSIGAMAREAPIIALAFESGPILYAALLAR